MALMGKYVAAIWLLFIEKEEDMARRSLLLLWMMDVDTFVGCGVQDLPAEGEVLSVLWRAKGEWMEERRED